jgi:hypothetical protein
MHHFVWDVGLGEVVCEEVSWDLTVLSVQF